MFGRIATSAYAFLLDSVKEAGSTGRYSFIGSDPYLVFQSKGDRIQIHRGEETVAERGNPLAVLKALIQKFTLPKSGDDLPPFFGGAVGYFGYDLVRFLEPIPALAADDLGCPDLVVMFVETVLAFDHHEETLQIIFTPSPERVQNTPRKILLEEGLHKIGRLEEILRAPVPAETRGAKFNSPITPESNLTKDQYVEMIRRCKDYIAAGDIYQANLSQRLSVPFDHDPWPLYKTLREINPSPFSGFLKMNDLCLVSASPERLVRLQGGIVETRPIAGTRPRGRTPQEDEGMTLELLANEKERAEHLMLVDLERNDLGKICRYGSVEVNEFMVTEQYSHVIHIVSNVRGRLSPGRDCIDVIRAVFPGGTITGVPKVRCMQIIDELEPVSRGPYTGSFGYISFAGEMDLNIIIRTFIITGGRAYVQVGAGIVADSDPEREYQETLYKAQALITALGRIE